MKYILIAFFAVIATKTFSQATKITISANNTTLHISLDSENENNLFLIHSNQFGDKDFLTIKVDSEAADKEWKRNFFIYDSANNAIKDFVLMNDKTYCLKLNELKKILVREKEYFIYTSVIPKDPQKAMLIKVAKQLVCKIKIL
ncbi:MAG TPA: hypothetical protein VGI61_09620 [Parafilimonas sp.]|jgi:hypothetical protein